MLKKLLLGAALFAAGATVSLAQTAEQKAPTAAETIEKAGGEAVERLKAAELAKVVEKAAKVLRETQNAVLLLGQGKDEEALKLLKKVSKELEELIEEYGLVRLPVDVTFVEFDGVSDLETAKKLNAQVKELVKNNNFVDARFLLNLLRNEIDITTTYMPLALYKQAVDLAVKLLEEGKRDAALLALQSALGTLEIEVVVIPKPLLEAQLLVEKAEELYQVNPEEALKLLERAKYDVELTIALGYVSSEKDVEPLLEKIEKLMKAVKEHAETTGKQFEEVKKGLEQLRQEATTTR
ncbi:MAG: YfdX family protein [Aquificae bacterium]|nr:YfdX family protein [Aquificota bacterium]